MFQVHKVSLFVFVMGVVALQLCRCDSLAESEDNPLLSREDIAKLSGIRVQARSFPAQRRCTLYAESLKQSVVGKLPENLSTIELFDAVISVLKQRELPYKNSQPVLTDLEECASLADALEQIDQQVTSTKREVIASPSRKEEPSPVDDDRIQKILEEHTSVKERTKDQGQDIYYKPQGSSSHVSSPIKDEHREEDRGSVINGAPNGSLNGHDEHIAPAADHKDVRDAEDDLEESTGESPYRPDARNESEHHGNDLLLEELRGQKVELEKLIEQQKSEIESLQDEVSRYKRKLATSKSEAKEIEQCRHRFKSMQELYEAAVEREERMRKIIGESQKKADKKEKKDEKKRIKDPADQAAILYDKFNGKDQPEDRCYKYYLLFSHQDKVFKATIKTIARLQVNLKDMNDFYSQVNPVLLHKLERIVDELAGSSKKDAVRASKEFKECLGGFSTYREQLNPSAAPDSDKFRVPIEIIAPKRKTEERYYKNHYQPVYQGFGGSVNRGGRSMATASAAASVATGGGGGGFGGSNYAEMQPLDSMSAYDMDYSERNPYTR